MLKLVAIFAVTNVCFGAKWPMDPATSTYKGDGTPPSFDCNMKAYAYKYGMYLIPRMGKFESLYYALGLNECNTTMSDAKQVVAEPNTGEDMSAAIFVAPDGSDDNAGTMASPLKSLQLAADLASKRENKTIILRDGTHYIADTIYLTAKHSGVEFVGYPGESPTVSGGVELKVDWKPFKVGGTCGDSGVPCNIYMADIKGQVPTVPGLQINGARATRARYPNLPGGIEVSPGYDYMIPSKNGKWTPPEFNKFGNVTFYTDSDPMHDRNVTAENWFQHYMIGVNGLCSVYDPPVSYWCSEHPSGGGAFAFRTPSGVSVTQGKGNTLPNAPYKDISEAVFFVWRPARWANWMFNIKDGGYDAETGNFTFGYGGFQGARGSNDGGDFFVENVMEELDNPGEFFYDSKASTLYLFHNGTGAPPSSATVVVPQKFVLLNASGTMWNPVTNVALKGIHYTATAYTYMKPHGVPSAGDWALDRWGAIYLQGTTGAMIDGCTFDRLDGNAVMVSGYNRNATIQNSDFSFIGGNAIAAWGYTNETDTDPGRPGVKIENAPKAGVDGTDGNHPVFTTVIGNTAREVGLYEKQSSFFVQAKTAQTVIKGNVFFNGPRAGINANDGFGGGDEIAHNLVFSACRESGDHGPFNSWDRQPFLTTVRTGEPSMIMQWREIHHNFFIDNYSPQENVDNDDGSAYYHTHDNFFVYGGNGMKNDFGGHDNYHLGNIYAYVGEAIGFYDAPMLQGHEDHFEGNTVIMTGSKVGNYKCGIVGSPIVTNNTFYTSDGTVEKCGKAMNCNKYPSDEAIFAMASAKLMPSALL